MSVREPDKVFKALAVINHKYHRHTESHRQSNKTLVIVSAPVPLKVFGFLEIWVWASQ